MLTGRVNNRGLDRLFGRLAGNARDSSRMMRRVAVDMLRNTEEHFDKESWGSASWKALSEVTTKRRAAKGKWPGKMLQVSGGLAGSIQTDSDSHSAAVGTNKKYAGTMERGAKKGSYGRTKRGAPIPWGDIPARKFLAQTDEEIQKHAVTIKNYLVR